MKRPPPPLSRLVLAALLLVALAVPATRADPLPDNLIDPAHRLDPLNLPPAWREILAPLQRAGGVRAGFIERRGLPFRRGPIELHGELRLHPEHGLALHYLPPEDSRVLIDDEGVLMRDARGRSRAAPADSRAQAATAVLLDVMRLDLAALGESYAIYGAHADGRWRLWFEPTAAAARAGLDRIIVDGGGGAVSMIQLRRSARQFIEISVGVAETGVEFSAEERARFFR